MFQKIILVLCAVLSRGYSQPPFMDYESSPVLDDSPVEVTAKVGTQAVLPCPVTNVGITSVSWMLKMNQLSSNDKMTTADQRMSIDSQSGDQWNLVIDTVQVEDAGTYECMVQSFPPQFKYVTLIIIAPPRIDRSELQEKYNIMERSSLNIMCKAHGFPIPVVNWYVYKADPLTQEKKELVSETKMLHIQRLNRSHQGIYRCEATNEQGTDFYEVYIDPIYKPKVMISTPEVRVKYGAMASLACEVESNPLSVVEWERNGVTLKNDWKYELKMELEISDTKKLSELTIRHTENSDNGEYKCSSHNTVGKDEQTVNLIVVPTITSTETIPKITTTKPTIPKITTTKPTTTASKPPGNFENTTPDHEKKPAIGASKNDGVTLFRNQLSMVLPVLIVVLIALL